jgi:Icc protein
VSSGAIQTSPPPIRVLHVTDPHLFADPSELLRGTVTHSSFRDVLAHIGNSDWPADFMAMTGDIIQDDSAEAYDQFRALTEPMKLPIFCVPGNHDVRDLMRDALSKPPYQYCGQMERGDWLIVGIDSCVSDSAGGRVSDQEMHRLKTAVADSAANHVLVCLHHPPLKLGSKWLDTVGLIEGPEFLDTVSALGKVKAIIFGHAHQAIEVVHNSMHVIGTPSTCRQFKVASDNFDLDDNPPAYRRISLHSDGSVQSELIWLAT